MGLSQLLLRSTCFWFLMAMLVSRKRQKMCLRTSTLDLNTLLYSNVIDAYLKNRDYNMAIVKMLVMKRDGVEPDQRIWTCIIRVASLCSETCDAINLLNSLRGPGFDLLIRLLTEKPVPD